MSEEEKGFLARWSQRKQDARKEAPAQAAPDAPAEQAKAAREGVASETEPPFDLSSLPKLEELTANTDLTVFFRKGVPESLRNAALRKFWALDPAIRNYVNPALDYAYDWNTPGGVPGAGELAPGTDVARMVSQVFGDGEQQPSQVSVDMTRQAGTDQAEDPSGDIAEQTPQPDAPQQSVRLSEATSPSSLQREQRADALNVATDATDSDRAKDAPQDGELPFASQQGVRRHGSARPK